MAEELFDEIRDDLERNDMQANRGRTKEIRDLQEWLSLDDFDRAAVNVQLQQRIRSTALRDFVFDMTNGTFEKSLDTDHLLAHCATLSGGEHAVHMVASLELDQNLACDIRRRILAANWPQCPRAQHSGQRPYGRHQERVDQLPELILRIRFRLPNQER